MGLLGNEPRRPRLVLQINERGLGSLRFFVG
jgi:hypothetical protein